MACSNKHCSCSSNAHVSNSACGSCGRPSHHHHHHCSSGCDCGRSANRSCENGCYGTLRAVPGPFHPACNDCCRPNYPYYTGPCGPCNPCTGCGCNNNCSSDCGCKHCHCCHCCNDCHDGGECACCTEEDCCDCEDNCDCQTGASFTAASPVELPAGGCVQFAECEESGGDFSICPGGIRIHREGTYMVFYSVHVPANETVSSRFVLVLNGKKLDASAADVVCTADGRTGGCSAHTMLHARAGSVLKLESLAALAVCPAAASNVFALSIARIC